MTVYFNKKLPADERAWGASNGATRRNLLIINKLGIEIPANKPVQCRLGYLDKGNHSFIFINPGNNGNNTHGVFLCSDYGYEVEQPELEVYCASSSGGPGNSESKFGIYLPNASLAVHSYKNRTGDWFYRFDSCKGWIDVLPQEKFEGEVIML